MTRLSNVERRRAANVLGAFALALTDKITGAVQTSGACSDMTSAALVQITFEPGLSIERLRLALGLSHSATVRLIDAAQREGLVTRERGAGADARVAALHLTSRGQKLARAILDARAGVIEPVLAKLAGDDIAALVAIVERAFPAVVDPGPDQDVVCRLCDVAVCPQDRCPVVCEAS